MPNPARARLAFYVQHLLGIGHLARACRIAEAAADDGWEVDLIVGGELPQGLSAGAARIVPLPPVRAGAGTLSSLLHPDGTPFEAEARDWRRDMLLAHVAARPPDALVIESFPFGRRQMRFELVPLLEQVARSATRPLVACSVRDILQENRRPDRLAETLASLQSHFDLVLVHGDPALVTLAESFPAAPAFADKIAYTGLVAPKPPREPPAVVYDVVVSVGGGAVGERLLRASLDARAISRLADARWLLLHGPNLPQHARSALADRAGPGLTLTPFVPDLAALLRGAAVSVSQAGYNTVADILVAGCRAVVIPYAEAGETEQSMRAGVLAERGRVVTLAEAHLTPENLAAAIDQALDSVVGTTNIDTDGARASSRILRAALGTRIGFTERSA